jgi:dethiobiotin synthetase
VSAGLVRASRYRPAVAGSGAPAEPEEAIHYVKPMQCGGSDESFVERTVHLSVPSPNDAPIRPWKADTLFYWETPASPHTASRKEGLPCSDAQVCGALEDYLRQTVTAHPSTVTWIETAGGVLSPSAASPDNDGPLSARQGQAPRSSPLSWGWKPQGDVYLPLAASSTTVLVGDGKLGGISATLSALESLLWRGYEVPAVVLIAPDEDRHDNAAALREYARGRYGLTDSLILGLPPIPSDPAVPLDEWYLSETVTSQFSTLEEHLADTWKSREVEDQARGSFDPSLAFRWARTYNQKGPAWLKADGARKDLMELLLASSYEWADEVGELSYQTKDAASAARSWAEQTALATYQKRMRVTEEERQSMEWAVCKHRVPSFAGSSEGGDQGDAEETEEDLPWISAKDLVLEAPTLAFTNGQLGIRFPEGLEPSPDTVTEFDSIEKALDTDARMISRKLFSQYKELIEMQWLVYEHTGINRKIGAIFIEPLVSNDFVWVDPLWQRALIDVAESRNIPVIFDETNLDHGMPRGSEILKVDPDVAITGRLPSATDKFLMATLLTSEASDARKDVDEDLGKQIPVQVEAIDCVAAAHVLQLQELSESNSTAPLSFSEDKVKEVSKLDGVRECFALGGLLAVRLNGDVDHHGQPVATALKDAGASAQIDGDRIVFFVDPHTGKEQRREILDLCLAQFK